ncbi:MAG: imidazole glycerol phosphate synthase subunit HisH [Pseudomonadota bacterium]
MSLPAGTVALIDNGGANVASVVHALERLGVNAERTASPERIAAADRVILPGVGAAADAMSRLQASGLDRLIPTLTQPVLGICLGMQLLFAGSDEGDVACLGVMPGRATRFPAGELPVPHMGWNELRVVRPHALLTGLKDGDYAYFVHSYALPVSADTLVTADYGNEFTAIAAHGNFHGAQFHPERSARVGSLLLANVLRLPAGSR